MTYHNSQVQLMMLGMDRGNAVLLTMPIFVLVLRCLDMAMHK